MRLVEIATMASDPESLVVKSILESHDITVVIRSPLTQSVYPIPVNGAGRLRLLVPEEDADRAREIIDVEGLPRFAGE